MEVDVSPHGLRMKVLAAAEQRRPDQKRCSAIDSVSQAFEIIGIDSDDDDVQEVSGAQDQDPCAPAVSSGTVSPGTTIKSDDDEAPNIIDLAEDATAFGPTPPRPRKRKRDRDANQETKASADPADIIDLSWLDDDY